MLKSLKAIHIFQGTSFIACLRRWLSKKKGKDIEVGANEYMVK